MVGFCGGRKTGEPGEKPSEQGENQQQTQPTCDAGSGNRTRATAVGGERSHHCAIPAPRCIKFVFSDIFCLDVNHLHILELSRHEALRLYAPFSNSGWPHEQALQSFLPSWQSGGLQTGEGNETCTKLKQLIDPLHKWRLNMNNNTWYILSLTSMFQDKGTFT